MQSAQESSAASHKCHFRVRHFGSIFELPYKKLCAGRSSVPSQVAFLAICLLSLCSPRALLSLLLCSRFAAALSDCPLIARAPSVAQLNIGCFNGTIIAWPRKLCERTRETRPHLSADRCIHMRFISSTGDETSLATVPCANAKTPILLLGRFWYQWTSWCRTTGEMRVRSWVGSAWS